MQQYTVYLECRLNIVFIKGEWKASNIILFEYLCFIHTNNLYFSLCVWGTCHSVFVSHTSPTLFLLAFPSLSAANLFSVSILQPIILQSVGFHFGFFHCHIFLPFYSLHFAQELYLLILKIEFNPVH